jgi:hypothetical protein
MIMDTIKAKENQPSHIPSSERAAEAADSSGLNAAPVIKAGDIYRFRYSVAERERMRFTADHCFEGLLHVRELNGELRLVDTYWGIGGDGRMFTLQDAERKGTLTFYCNLHDVEPIKEYEQVYYADEDLFTVSEQHACVPRRVHWFKRKGAERNADKMLRVLGEQVRECQQTIASATRKLADLAVTKEKIYAGNLDVYL